jgi:hypothetical protein
MNFHLWGRREQMGENGIDLDYGCYAAVVEDELWSCGTVEL